jgi:hypothetical protein
MSHAFHAYVINKSLGEDWSFGAIKELFNSSYGMTDHQDSNPFTNQNILNLTFEENYVISVFYEEGEAVVTDLDSLGVKCDDACRIRVLFGIDPENEYDDIGIALYDFLENLDDVVIYSPNQDRIIHNSLV